MRDLLAAIPVVPLVLAHVAATLFMTGLIWFVQVVHYPLFGAVGGGDFVAYALEHQRRTTLVVAAPMLLELATGVLLVLRAPAAVGRALPLAGLALLAVVWLSTALLQVPAHARLAGGFDGGVHGALVAGNVLRTVAWSARAVLVLLMAARLMRA